MPPAKILNTPPLGVCTGLPRRRGLADEQRRCVAAHGGPRPVHRILVPGGPLSVLIRQQQTGTRSVGLGDDPDLRPALPKGVGAEEAPPVLEALRVLTPVVGVQLALVAAVVAGQKVRGVRPGFPEDLQSAGLMLLVA